MRRVDELSVRRPAVALQDAGIVGTEHARRLGEAASVFNRVGRGVRRGKRPQPVGMAADLPPGFIRRDDGTPAHGGAERLVGRLRLARRTLHRVDQPAAGHGEAEAIAEQVRDPAKGESALFVEDDGQRHGVRSELHRRRAERVRGLQRMTALHPPVTLPALADRHAKLVHDGPLHGQIFLVLRNDAAVTHRPAAVGTLRRERRLMRHIDPGRRWTMGLAAIRGARLASRPLRILLRQAARKRGRLPIRPAARHVEFFFQPLVLAPQPVALDLRTQEVLTELFDLPRLIIDDLPRVRRRRVFRAPRHGTLMPDSRIQYKRESPCLGVSVARHSPTSGSAER